MPRLKGVEAVEKPERGRFENRDVHEKSSDVIKYNLFDQDWQTLVDEGLAHYIKPRKFRATAIRQADSAGVGLEEYTGKADDVEIIAIHSIYYDMRLSNRDVCMNAIQYVQSLLDEGETAAVRCASMYVKHGWAGQYMPQVDTRQEPFSAGFNDVYKLANDAIKRRSSITEGEITN